MIRRIATVVTCLTMATAAAAALPTRASAGQYTVSACHTNGVNNSWQSFTTNGFAAAYVECPGGVSVNGHANEGMVARNSIGPGMAPYFSHARVFFDAPPGAQVIRVRGEIKQNSGSGGWLAGIYDETGNSWASCTFCGTSGSWARFGTQLSAGRVSALAMCSHDSGCARDTLHGYVAIRNVEVVVSEVGPPSVAVRGGSLVAPGWQAGIRTVAVEATDPVGIRGLVLLVDDTEVKAVNRPCDYSRPLPCPSGTDSPTIDTRAFQDGRHRLRVVAFDAGGETRSVERTLLIDNHAPGRPLSFRVDEGTAWTSHDTFNLRWSLPTQSAAPLARAHIQLCPVPATAGSPCVPPRSVGRVTSAAVRVPRAGEWRARVWLQDSAGNASATNASEAPLRVDDKPPSLAFRSTSADRPAVVRVATTDDRSGIGTREILVRRRGSSSWISLPVSVQPNGFSAFVDDEHLPDGIYALRARAVDRAGNERTTDRLSNGKPAMLALPLRIKTRLKVGRPTRVRARGAHGKRRYQVKLVKSPRARYGRTIPLRGRLTSPGGNPLADREVRVLEQTKLSGSPWRLIATVKTSRTGRFTFRALRGPSRTLRFRFGGSDTIRGRSANVRLGVRAATSMRASRRRVVNGEGVEFRGRLRGRPLPRPGKLIELQAYARGRWLTFGTTRANPRTGRWSYPYRFSATRGNVRYRFRARVPKEASYPYETGASRGVTVNVRGL